MSYFKDVDKTKLCEEGDKLYRIGKNGIQEVTITEVKKAALGHYVYRDNLRNSFFGHRLVKSYFKTIEEAEKAMQRNENIAKKRQLMKEYEKKLNEELGITDHILLP